MSSPSTDSANCHRHNCSSCSPDRRALTAEALEEARASVGRCVCAGIPRPLRSPRRFGKQPVALAARRSASLGRGAAVSIGRVVAHRATRARSDWRGRRDVGRGVFGLHRQGGTGVSRRLELLCDHAPAADSHHAAHHSVERDRWRTGHASLLRGDADGFRPERVVRPAGSCEGQWPRSLGRRRSCARHFATLARGEGG